MTEDAGPLVAEGLSKSYGEVVALAPLDLTLRAGQLTVLVGHNGAGKTTFTNLVAGLLQPTTGEVLIDGARAGTPPARAAVSYLADAPSLYDDLSVREHAQYVAALHDVEGWTEHADVLLSRLRLADRADDLPSRFSRGLRQKTAILLAFIRPFSLFVADEPFVGLDAAGKREFIEMAVEAAADGAAVLISTHQLEFLERAERCLALRDGELIFDGPPSDADLSELIP